MPGMVDLNANVIFNFCFILILEGFPFAMWAKTDSTFIMAKQCWGYWILMSINHFVHIRNLTYVPLFYSCASAVFQLMLTH